MHEIETNLSTIIPQESGKEVDDQSSLSKTQKKRLKAKSKGKVINKGVKNVFQDFRPIDFDIRDVQVNAIIKEQTLPKISANDPLFTSIQKLIDQEQEIDKLEEDEIYSVLEIVEGRKIPDWRNQRWSVQAEMLRVCFEKSMNLGRLVTTCNQEKFEQKAKIFDSKIDKILIDWCKDKG